MPIVNGYATVAEFQAWSQIGGLAKVDQMELSVNAASRAIDEWCQRHFWKDGTALVPSSRTFATCNSRELRLGPFNDLTMDVAPVVATDTDGDGVFETAWTATDWQLLPFNPTPGWPRTSIRAVGSLLFPSGTTGRVDRVQVTGVWGWPAVPYEVTQACLIKATRLLTRMQSPNGIAGLDQFGPVRINRTEDGDVVSLLEPYRRIEARVTVA